MNPPFPFPLPLPPPIHGHDSPLPLIFYNVMGHNIYEYVLATKRSIYPLYVNNLASNQPLVDCLVNGLLETDRRIKLK